MNIKKYNFEHKPAVYEFLDSDQNVVYVGSTCNLYKRMEFHRSSIKNLGSKSSKSNEKLYEYLSSHEYVVLWECYETVSEARAAEREWIEKEHPMFNRTRVQSINPLYLVSSKEDYNKYHRDYLQKNREYNAEHAEYCRNYYQTHKDYFKKKYAEYKARKESK